MKKIISVSIIFIVVPGIYIYYILSGTGFFREIEYKPYGEVFQEIPIVGAEDFAISYEDSFMIISATDRMAIKRGEPAFGGLYYLDLTASIFQPQLLTANIDKSFNPHGISIWKLDSSNYKVFAINHAGGKHSIEVFLLSDETLFHQETLEDEWLKDPNDLVLVSENQFYLTNDHGYKSRIGVFLESYLGLEVSSVVYFDGESFSLAADGISYANGIAYNSKSAKLYVASSRWFLIREYNVAEDGSITFLKDIPAGSGVDNLEFDNHGVLYSGCHPNLIAFTRYAQLKAENAPSEVVRIKLHGENPEVECIFTDDGNLINASSVAAPFGNYLFVGTVMDDKLLVLKR